MMKYDSLIEMGLVEEQASDHAEVLGLMTRAERDLETSRLLRKTDEEWSFAVAYQAMSRAARALIMSEGFRPRGARGRDAQKTIVTAAGVILGEAHKSLINKFDRMRRKHQNFLEDPGRVISRYESDQAVKDAEELMDLVRGRIGEKYSQMSLLNGGAQLAPR